jgi:hypothetical protein
MKKFVTYSVEMDQNEVIEAADFMTERDIVFTENVFRPGSEKYFLFFNEARRLMNMDMLQVEGVNKEILNTDIGKFDMYEGVAVPLDCPMPYLEEEEKKEIGKVKRGGSKKFYVYVKDGDRVKKVSFGDKGGAADGSTLKTKINDPEARKSFAARHQCSSQTDRTSAAYWSCRLPRYAKSLGMQVNNPGAFW